MDVLVGSAASVRFDLQGPTGSLPPDNSSAAWTLYGQDGSVLAGPTALSTTTSQTTIPVAVNSSYNTIAGDHNFEKRTVVLTWASNGQSYTRSRSYRVISFLNFTATKEGVRSVLGVSEDELPDEDIDLVSAYYTVAADAATLALTTAPATLVAALASGGNQEIAANVAITCQAAYDCISSVRNRLLQSAQDGVQKVTRFTAVPDLDALEQDLRAKRALALSILTGVDPVLPTLMTLSCPLDIIRGDPRFRITTFLPRITQ